MFEIQEIQAKETYKLRHELLRPYQSIECCKYPGDNDQNTRHFGAFESGIIVGIVSIYLNLNQQLDCQNCWQLRAMATAESVRGKGYGKKLLKEAELYASTQKSHCIWANARKKAIGFYTGNGYAVIGNEFEVKDIGSHYLVFKKMN